MISSTVVDEMIHMVRFCDWIIRLVCYQDMMTRTETRRLSPKAQTTRVSLRCLAKKLRSLLGGDSRADSLLGAKWPQRVLYLGEFVKNMLSYGVLRRLYVSPIVHVAWQRQILGLRWLPRSYNTPPASPMLRGSSPDLASRPLPMFAMLTSRTSTAHRRR
jgi:hypothetical protein